MKIDRSNIKEAVNALRKCASEHKNEPTDTGAVDVSSLCNDVADFIENYSWASMVYQFDGDLTNKDFRRKLEEYPDNAKIAVECCHPEHLTYNDKLNTIYID